MCIITSSSSSITNHPHHLASPWLSVRERRRPKVGKRPMPWLLCHHLFYFLVLSYIFFVFIMPWLQFPIITVTMSTISSRWWSRRRLSPGRRATKPLRSFQESHSLAPQLSPPSIERWWWWRWWWWWWWWWWKRRIKTSKKKRIFLKKRYRNAIW